MGKNQISLEQLKSNLAEEQAKRDAVVAKGAMCYRMGILRTNNPEKDFSKRDLWGAGWEAARAKFNDLLKKHNNEFGMRFNILNPSY